MGEGHSTAPRTGLSRLIPILVVGTITVFLAACGGDEPTPAAIRGESIAPPTVDIATPSPTPTPVTPTPTPVPTLVPFRPTATLSPTPTPVPTPIPQELIDEIEAQLPTPRMNHEGLLLADGRVLFAGGTLPTVANNGLILGQPHPFLEIYDPATEEWSLVLPIDFGLVGVNTVSLPDGTFLVFSLRKPEYESNYFWPLRIAGEDDSPLPLYTVSRLDTEEQMLSDVSTATIPRLAPSLIPMADGRVMVVGGSSLEIEEGSFGLPKATDVEIYDPVSNTWEIAAPLGSELLESLLISDEETLLLWAGSYQDGAAVVLAGDVGNAESRGVIMLYDTMADEWETLTEFGFDSFRDTPRVSVVSGGTFNFFYVESFAIDFSTVRVEIFDPASREWSLTSGRRAIPSSSSITELPDGRLFIAGGDRSEDSGLPGTATFLYDPLTGLWAAGPELTESRSNHSATVLSNGSVLLFSGVTIWEENESEGVPTNSMEIIRAAQIAAVDTVTPQKDATFGLKTWQVCIGATDIEIPPLSTTGDVETTLSAAEIIRQSAQAMTELESYAVDIIYNWSQLNEFVHLSYVLNSYCAYYQNVFLAPDRLMGRQYEIYGGQPYENLELVTIGETTYSKWNGEELWDAGDTDQSADMIAPHTEILPAESEVDYGDFRVVGILTVDGMNVFQISGVTTSDWGLVSDITFWIGADDMLLRRYYSSERESGEFELTDVTDFALVFHSFNEDFDIQAPPESEIAEPEE